MRDHDHNHGVRQPTAEERDAVVNALVGVFGEPSRGHVGRFPIAVIEYYATTSPGYYGPVAVALDGDGRSYAFALPDEDTAAPLNEGSFPTA